MSIYWLDTLNIPINASITKTATQIIRRSEYFGFSVRPKNRANASEIRPSNSIGGWVPTTLSKINFSGHGWRRVAPDAIKRKSNPNRIRDNSPTTLCRSKRPVSLKVPDFPRNILPTCSLNDWVEFGDPSINSPAVNGRSGEKYLRSVNIQYKEGQCQKEHTGQSGTLLT